VAYGVSLVRELPFSQVKSANAKGYAFPGFAAPDLLFSVACEGTTAVVSFATRSVLTGVVPDVALAIAPDAVPGAATPAVEAAGVVEAGCFATASAPEAALGFPLPSRSATRF